MSELPTPETVASLVSEASENMWGVPFTLVEGAAGNGATTHAGTHSRRVLLEMTGANALSVVVSSDEAGGTTLGGIMFACDEKEVNTGMIDDSLCELANILAGQLKTLMAPSHKLGLPTVLGSKVAFQQSESSQARLRIGEHAATVWVTVAAA